MDAKRKAIEENIKAAKKSGNVLTQTIDEEGNLVGVKETTDFESRDVEEEEATDKRNNELINSLQSSS
jgi:hypothetical protein